MAVSSVTEGVTIALESLRANRVRAALTILGIVIGVATVMAMAAMIVGIRSTITGELDAMGPNNFTVERYDQTQVAFVNGPGSPPWEGKPRITPAEARLIEGLREVESVTAAVSASAELRYEAVVIPSIQVRGRGHLWPDYVNGDFIYGRNFLEAEERRNAQVVVLSETASNAVFGPRQNPVGEYIRLRGEQFQVIGVFREPTNLFTGSGSSAVTVPAGVAISRLRANADWYALLVVPRPGVPQADAIDQVTATLRASRGLRPSEDNDFAVIRQEALMDMFNQISGAFFLVMLVLSSIGLLVGGVGVVAIMMISVTERTREIGVRKALGATRKEILWQFLVESMTVTVIGGAIGIVVGGGVSLLVDQFTPIPAAVPLWSVFAALGVSAVTGIGFGLYPANKAARLDPVEALRYE